MKTFKIFGIIFGILVALLLVWGGISYVNYHNKEVNIKNLIEAKYVDNQNVLDSAWKQVKKSAQIAEKEKDGFIEFMRSAMENRGTVNGKSALFSMLKEQYPNMPQFSYTTVMNIVTSKTDEFQKNQTLLMDMCREYRTLVQRIPSSWFLTEDRLFEREYCKIITSTHTEEVFETGKDDDLSVF